MIVVVSDIGNGIMVVEWFKDELLINFGLRLRIQGWWYSRECSPYSVAHARLEI